MRLQLRISNCLVLFASLIWLADGDARLFDDRSKSFARCHLGEMITFRIMGGHALKCCELSTLSHALVPFLKQNQLIGEIEVPQAPFRYLQHTTNPAIAVQDFCSQQAVAE